MKPALIAALVLFVASSPDARPSTKPTETQIAIDKLRAAMKGPLEVLSTLAEEDKKLARSNEDQSGTSKMLERLKRKIETQDQPALKKKFEALEERIRLYIASGCPEFAQTVPPAVYERCNPPRAGLRAELEALIKEDEALKRQLADIAPTQKAVTDTTLSNFAKQKANAARREDLEALKLAQASQLRKLYMTGIAEVVKRLDLKAKAARACQAIPTLEEAVCCEQVVSDGRNPAQCNVPLIVSVFEKAGIFGSTIVK